MTSSWVPWQSCLVWKKAFQHFQQIEHFRYNKWCLCENVLAHEPKIAAVVNRIEFQMVSLTSRRPYLCPSEGHSYGISILSFIILRGKVRQITRERYTAQTWNLEKLFIYLSSILFEIHSFCSWMVSNLFFDCVTVKTSNTLLESRDIYLLYQMKWGLDYWRCGTTQTTAVKETKCLSFFILGTSWSNGVSTWWIPALTPINTNCIGISLFQTQKSVFYVCLFVVVILLLVHVLCFVFVLFLFCSLRVFFFCWKVLLYIIIRES